MIRNYKNYNIQQRKDGRHTVAVTDHDHRTYFNGKMTGKCRLDFSQKNRWFVIKNQRKSIKKP